MTSRLTPSTILLLVLPPLLWAAIILALTSIPIPGNVAVPGGDKTAHVLDVLDRLWDVTQATGGAPFATIGRAKVELIQLEDALRRRDRAAEQGPALPLEVALAIAGRSA